MTTAGRAGVLLRAMRPRHWLKNGFVFAPAVFAGHAFDLPAMVRVASVAFAFCLISSAGYLLNDVLDRDADRADPVKKNRPVASGELGPGAALAWAVLLSVLSVCLTLPEGWPVTTALLGYAALTTLYSLVLKTVPVIEAMTLAAGFVVRLAAGALAIQVEISHWLVICGFLLALLLAFGKRVPEAKHPAARTPVYPASYLQDVVNLLAGVTLVAYILYTVSPETVAKVGSRGLLLTVPFVLFGILRYLLLLHQEGAQDPTAVLVTDRPLLVTVVAWVALAAALLVPHGTAR